MSEKEEKKEGISVKSIIICAVVVLIVIICIVLIVNGRKNKKVVEGQGSETASGQISSINYDNVQVSTVKFKLKNSLSKNISKIYIRDNTNTNFSKELSQAIKDGEEVEVSYGNYNPVFVWDFKIIFEDGTETTLNSLIAANVLYDGAALELVGLGENAENVGVINHDMITFNGNE